jgi:hypothetical protein
VRQGAIDPLSEHIHLRVGETHVRNLAGRSSSGVISSEREVRKLAGYRTVSIEVIASERLAGDWISSSDVILSEWDVRKLTGCRISSVEAIASEVDGRRPRLLGVRKRSAQAGRLRGPLRQNLLDELFFDLLGHRPTDGRCTNAQTTQSSIELVHVLGQHSDRDGSEEGIAAMREPTLHAIVAAEPMQHSLEPIVRLQRSSRHDAHAVASRQIDPATIARHSAMILSEV